MKIRKGLAPIIGAFLFLAAFVSLPARAQFQSGSRAGGRYNAAFYNYGSGTVQGAMITVGNTATGTQTITVCFGGPGLSLPDGRVIQPFSVTAPITVDPQSGSNVETVTPTAVSTFFGSPLAGGQSLCANITASFSFTHGQSLSTAQVASGSFGLQEAINDAFNSGGGTVVVDHSWPNGAQPLNAFPARPTTTTVTMIPYPSVTIEDTRLGSPTFWSVGQLTATVIAAPTTLTATTVGFGLNGANTTGGTYTGASTYHVAVACVDINGNESQPSADFSGLTAGTGTANQIGIAAPAAQTGCVAWVPYISLAGGTYALAYRVPVATFSNGVPTANGVCTLNQALAQIGIAACQITNATYGTTGSAAIVSALTVNTARIWVGVGGTSTTADIVGNSNARQSYGYVPGNHVATPGVVPASLVFSTPTAAATTVPEVMGTIQLPANFMNFAGRRLRICGKATQAAAGSTATVDTVEFYWDADGSNTTGAGIIIGSGINETTTLVTANADSLKFCDVLKTTVTSTSVTGGSIQATEGDMVLAGGITSTSNAAGVDTSVGATSGLDLANEARIDVVWLHTTGTDANGFILQDLTVEVLN